jgi:hypothetical protein
MKNLYLPLAILALILSACSSTEYVPRNTIAVRTFDLNIHSLQGPVRVDPISNGAAMRAVHFNMLGDSAMWLDADSKQPIVFSLADVKGYTINDRVEGGLQGMLFGIGAGVALGTAVDLAADNPGGGHGIIGLGVLVGEFGGLIIGELIGADHHVVFGNEPPPR